MTTDDIKTASPPAMKLIARVAAKYSWSHIPFEDLKQEAYLALLSNIDKYDPSRGAIEPWMRSIISRTITNLLSTSRERVEKDSLHEILEDTPDPSLEHPSDVSGSILRGFYHVPGINPLQTSKDLLESILVHLTPRQREVMILRYKDGMTQAEVADHLSISKQRVSEIERISIRKLKTIDLVIPPHPPVLSQ